MVGIAGRSGPPGHTGHNLRHGAYSKALIVPEGREWVGAIVDSHYGEILAELGGEENVTERKQGVLRAAMIFLKRALLLEAELILRGDVKPDGLLRDAVAKQPAFLKGYVECLKLIGLERRAADLDDLDALLRQEARADRAKAGP